MNRASCCAALLAVAGAFAAPAIAQSIGPVSLPDLAPPRALRVELRWQDQPSAALFLPGPMTRGGEPESDARFHEMRASIPIVEHRFDLRAWRGRQVRIDFVVPPLVDGLQSTSAMRVQWEGGAVLRSGSARPGERVTVFSGRVDVDMLLERLSYTLVVDSRFFDGRIRFKPAFELEAR